MSLRTAAALALASTVALAAACGSEHPPVAELPMGNGVDAFDGGSPVSPEPDAAISNPSLCTELELGGEVVVERELVGGGPEPVGGEVLEGTYDLTEVTTYIASNPDCAGAQGDCPRMRRTDRVAQATLVVTEYAMKRVEAVGVNAVGAPAISAVVYEIDGSYLATTTLCPIGGTKDKTAYSASGSALTFLVDGREELFVKRP